MFLTLRDFMTIYLPLQIPCLDTVKLSQIAVEHDPLAADIKRGNLSNRNNVWHVVKYRFSTERVQGLKGIVNPNLQPNNKRTLFLSATEGVHFLDFHCQANMLSPTFTPF